MPAPLVRSAPRTNAARMEGDVDCEVGRQAVADARDHRAVRNPVQPFRRRISARRLFSARGRVAAVPGVLARRGVDRTHFGDNLLDLAGVDNRLVVAEELPAFVGNRLLEIRHDFRAVGIALELALCAREVLAERIVPAFVELVRVAIQVEADDFLHAIVQAA
jgi:hypothetical protein